ncbi:MAG: efflux RND transporter periplasmic adaptor subunit, partial [Phycisphaerales bacterium]|nr:efflux RND transporter periplasmic adaptor subunit [Phycisphaerales bacterium]
VESIGLLAEGGGWRDPNRREYTVRIAVDAGEHSERLKPSMRCQAEIILGSVQDAISVPVQAVFSEGPVQYVLIPAGPRFVRRPVQLGRRSDMYAEIVKGVEPGDRVLIREPLPGEVIEDPWATDLLTAAGYTLDEDGKPVSHSFGRRGPRAPGGGKPRGGDPQSSTKDTTGKEPQTADPNAESTADPADKAEPIETAAAESEDSAAPAPEPNSEPADPAG